MSSASFSEPERAALALTEAVARYRASDPLAGTEALAQARHHFGELEVTRIVQVAAGEHFFNPATGGLGLDASSSGGPTTGRDSDGEQMPCEAIASGITARGWL